MDGHVAEWLRSGLQNRLHQFNSGRGLHQINHLKCGFQAALEFVSETILPREARNR